MSGKIEMFDLEKEMLVTVLNGKYYENAGHEDNSYKGEVLEVKAVDLPYVALERSENIKDWGKSISLDLRDWDLKQVTEDYAKSKGVYRADKKKCRLGGSNEST